MSVLKMLFRKMLRNKWLIICLLLGYIMFIALMCSIPLYTNGIMQNILDKEFENQQLERNRYPGYLRIDSEYDNYVGGYEVYSRKYNELVNYLEGEFLPSIPIAHEQRVYYHETAVFNVIEDGRQRQVPDDSINFRFGYFTDMYDNIELLEGSLPSDTRVGDSYEVIVSDLTRYNYHLGIGDEFVIKNKKLEDLGELRVKIVGIFKPVFDNELYWFDSISKFNRNIYLSNSLFEENFLNDFKVDKTIWYHAMDYHKINVDNVEEVFASFDELSARVKGMGFSVYIPTIESLPAYKEQQSRLTPLLVSLYVPIIIMLILYLFMVSSLVVQRQRNEISVLISRGAGRWQIMYTYFLESLILGLIGIVIGPLVAILLTRILGSTSNFLEFVNRKALDIHFNKQTLVFSLIGMVLSVFTTLLPTYFATGVNILEHKHNVTRRNKPPIWQRFFLDFLLLAISLYGYNRFNVRQQDIIQTGAESMSIDPLLFVVPAIFALSLAMIFIRVFPYLVEGLYRLGRRVWSLSMYTSLIQVARSANAYRFLTIFIVLTVSTGLYSATAARTINQNAQDKIKYANGADHILTAYWSADGAFDIESKTPPGVITPGGPEEEETSSRTPHYEEPPYNQFKQLPGVERTAKVLDIEGRFYDGKQSHYTRLMGIEPTEFAQTAWYPGGLGGQHWYYHINNMMHSNSMVLISRSVAETLNLKQWDVFTMYWAPIGMAQFMVAGIIDYWPSFNPNVVTDREEGVYDMLVVAHLNYLNDNSIIQPYDVWMRMEEGASTEDLYNALKESKILVKDISNINEDYIALNRDPVHLGLNGALTLVFIISIVIILSGFLIFWILAIHGRMFQSGIMMAMGLRLRELTAMITWEQVLTSVIPMLFGVVVGGISSALFVPMLQMSFAAKDQIPPFRVISYASDYIRVYTTLGILVVTGLAVIIFMLSRLQIFTCIKMGEDS